MKIRLNFIIGASIVLLVALTAIIGTVWTPHDSVTLSFINRFHPPSANFLLGTDEFGRDVASRLMKGAGASMGISLLTVLTALILGTLIGVVSGYWGGMLDRSLMVLTDALMSFPGILLALTLLAILGISVTGLVLSLGLAFTPAVIRIVRGNVLSLRQRDFIDASRLMGNSSLYTLWRHVLPNCLAPLIVLTTSMLGWALLAESALSFLGLGIAPPAPTWGNMLSASRAFLTQAPWLGIFPGVLISLTLLGINLLGDALRDFLDPRMKGV